MEDAKNVWTARFLQLVLTVLVGIALAPTALATTLAVLPLDRGAGSESLDGLGSAIAGLLIADLAAVDGITLVERARLDAVLDELKLSEGAFLDPATAQRLGAGLGAELVLIGSWSVTGERFLLDARIVEVESARIRAAGASEGTIDDFVSVQKDLVTTLLEGLDVALSASARRRLWSATPTERFEAFVAYGAGRDAEARGAWEAAAESYARALEADPAFVLARDAMSGVRTALEASRARFGAAAEATHGPILARITATVPDERTRPAGFVHDDASRAAFALRAMALENLEQPCARFEELLAFADREGWEIAMPRETIRAFDTLISEHGFAAVPHEVPGPKVARSSPRSRVHLFESAHRLLFDDEAPWRMRDGSGLGASLLACFSPSEQPTAFERVRASLVGTSGASASTRRARLPAATQWELFAAFHIARHHGLDAATERRIATLLDAHQDDDERADLQRQVDDVLREAQHWSDARAIRHGRSTDQLERVMRALATGDTRVLDISDPLCATIASTMRPSATHWVARLPKVREDHQSERLAWNKAGGDFAVIASLGCVRDVPSRFADTEALVTFLRAGVGQVREEKRDEPGCQMTVSMMESHLQAEAAERARVTPEHEAIWAYALLTMWYGSLQVSRCVDDRLP